jgi:DNA-3-methyladenine glycosylase II
MSARFLEVKKQLSKDPIMAKLIEQFGPIEITKYDNVFQHIVESIIGQQLSEKAGTTITNRFKALFPDILFPLPADILALEDQLIRNCGISFSKISYIKGLSQAVLDKTLELEKLDGLSNEEVANELTKIKGIGMWTAEMVMMFTLGRENVFSYGDVGLRNAINRLYSIEKNDVVKMQSIVEKWSPYKTYACRYLWKSLDIK